MFPWTVSALSSGGMSQMLGCASRGLGTWPEAGPWGTEFWASGAGGDSNRSRVGGGGGDRGRVAWGGVGNLLTLGSVSSSSGD